MRQKNRALCWNSSAKFLRLFVLYKNFAKTIGFSQSERPRGSFLKGPENVSNPKNHLGTYEPLILQSCYFNMSLRQEKLNVYLSFMLRNALVCKIHSELSFPISARNVSGLSRNARQVPHFKTRPGYKLAKTWLPAVPILQRCKLPPRTVSIYTCNQQEPVFFDILLFLMFIIMEHNSDAI